MTTLINKGQFVTIEFFTDEDRYKDGNFDFYFIHDLNDETIEEAIINTLGDVSEKVYINVSPRRYAEVVIEDNEIDSVLTMQRERPFLEVLLEGDDGDFHDPIDDPLDK